MQVSQHFNEMRLDAWLWVARFFKTRSLAKDAVENGRVQVEGQAAKPSRMVRPGLRLSIRRGEETFEVLIAGLAANRGPARDAQALYQEDAASRSAREALRAERQAARAGYSPPDSQPDKRARRLIRALGDIDATSS